MPVKFSRMMEESKLAFPIMLMMSRHVETAPILSIVLTAVVLIAISQKDHIWDFACRRFPNVFARNAQVTLVGTITEDRFGVRKHFSKRMVSLLHHVHTRLVPVSEDLRRLTEIFVDSSGGNFSGNGVDAFVLDQESAVRVDDSLYCTFRMTEDNTTPCSSFGEKFRCRFIRIESCIVSTTGTVNDIMTFLDKCQKEYDAYTDRALKQSVYCFTLQSVVEGKANYVKRPFCSNKTFDKLFFKNKDRVLRKLDTFINKQSVYSEFGVPHTLGFLFSGLPGCGKTACAKSIANYTKRHIVIIPLHKVSNMAVLTSLFFNEEIDSIRVPFDDRIYVFEEIDCNGWEDITLARGENYSSSSSINSSNNIIVLSSGSSTSSSSFHRYAKMAEEGEAEKVTLGGLLELLDGIAETPGRIIIITTNQPQKLDNALIRPGRIDVHIDFGLPTVEDIVNMVAKFFDGMRICEEDAERVVATGMSHAEICQYFMEYRDDFESALCVVTDETRRHRFDSHSDNQN